MVCNVIIMLSFESCVKRISKTKCKSAETRLKHLLHLFFNGLMGPGLVDLIMQCEMGFLNFKEPITLSLVSDVKESRNMASSV
jgi:hypothetical protein